MRPIPPLRIAIFMGFLCLLAGLAGGVVWGLSGLFDGGSLRGLLLGGLFGLIYYGAAFGAYRLLWRVLPVREGKVRPRTRNEWAYHLYLLFNLLLFYPLTRSAVVPVPLMRLVYQALGARLGSNTYPAGLILDPPLTEVGANTIIGQGAILAAHNLVGGRLFHQKIVIGDQVTIGGQVMIGAGVWIGDGALISAGARISPRVRIDPGVIVPAGMVVGVGQHLRKEVPSLPEEPAPSREGDPVEAETLAFPRALTRV